MIDSYVDRDGFANLKKRKDQKNNHSRYDDRQGHSF